MPVFRTCLRQALTRICDTADPASAARTGRLAYEPSKSSNRLKAEPLPEYSEDFRELVHTQLSFLLEILRFALIFCEGYVRMEYCSRCKVYLRLQLLSEPWTLGDIKDCSMQAVSLASYPLCSRATELQHRTIATAEDSISRTGAV